MNLIKYVTCSQCKKYSQYAILHFYKDNFVCDSCLKEEKPMNPPTLNLNLPLKPCPFCGKEAREWIYPLSSSIGVQIKCSSGRDVCSGESKTISVDSPRGEFGHSLKIVLETYEKAVDQWNTRA